MGQGGKGFRYLGLDGRALPAAEVIRIEKLVIPPAWTDVWICPDPDGHIQAMGTDAAGRRQYLYHEEWRAQRDREKHDRVLEFAGRLPAVRETVAGHLAERGYTRNRVLAAAVRLIDLGAPRAYAAKPPARANGTPASLSAPAALLRLVSSVSSDPIPTSALAPSRSSTPYPRTRTPFVSHVRGG